MTDPGPHTQEDTMPRYAITAFQPRIHGDEGRSQKGTPKAKVIGYAQAVAAYLSHFGEFDLADDGPVIYGVGFHSETSWVIGYEGGEYDWPWLFFEYLYKLRTRAQDKEDLTREEVVMLRLTSGFYMEACNGWSGSVYPL